MKRPEVTKEKVAVLGAGPAGLAAAFALAETGNYEVHIYQMGWRAGGKCATGREPGHLRAKQNGSHYLFGCYQTAFELARRAHEVIARSEVPDRNKFGSFEDDFVARNLLVGAQRYALRGRDNTEQMWFRYLPQNMAVPGEGGKFPTPFDVVFTWSQFALGTAFDFAYSLLLFWTRSPGPHGVRLLLKVLPVCPFERGRWSRIVRGVLRPVRWGFNRGWAAGAATLRALYGVSIIVVPERIHRAVSRWWSRFWPTVIRVLRRLARWLRDRGLLLPQMGSLHVQRLFILIDLGLTIFSGYFEDGLNRPGGYERIDQEDFRAWLERHGASKEARESALIDCWYDAVIAYVDGERDKASFSAGVCVYALLRALLAYKGAFAYQMRAEVGDSFVAPVARALELMGVRFHYYSRVERVVVGSASNAIERIELAAQAEPCAEASRSVFVDVPDQGHPRLPMRSAWPDAPTLTGVDIAQDELPLDSYYSSAKIAQQSLVRSAGGPGSGDFDRVISALPIEVVRDVLVYDDGRALADAHERWRACFDNIPSTESQAVRMWFNVPLRAKKRGEPSLGWRADPPILSGYRWPHSTWEDNTQAAGVHAFPSTHPLQTIATVFGPLGASGLDIRSREHLRVQTVIARRSAREFVDQAMLQLWPGLASAPGSREVEWRHFVDLNGGEGQLRFDWQHVTANVGPCEAYVMTFPGTLQYRLRADESHVANLFIAGDWTRNGVEVGTVEGAVISGYRAAYAICGQTRPIVGEHDLERGTLFNRGT